MVKPLTCDVDSGLVNFGCRNSFEVVTPEVKYILQATSHRTKVCVLTHTTLIIAPAHCMLIFISISMGIICKTKHILAKQTVHVDKDICFVQTLDKNKLLLVVMLMIIIMIVHRLNGCRRSLLRSLSLSDSEEATGQGWSTVLYHCMVNRSKVGA